MKLRYALGFSNGGLLMSDLVLRFGLVFAAACNYMGGYDDNVPEVNHE